MKYQILNGDNINILKTLPDNSIDSIITDPPYGIAFLGKDWDHKKATETTTKIAQLHNLPSGMKHTTLADDLEFQYWLRERWIECLRVLKPGGHLLAFSAARTYHHMAMSLQTAGFEIRDQIMWIYSSGFPKSQDVGRSIQRGLGVKEKEPHKNNVPRNGGAGETKHYESDGQVVVTDPEAKHWAGWGTALKPAHEPICLARKPSKLSIAKNVQKWGTGALNIDATRIAIDGVDTRSGGSNGWDRVEFGEADPNKYDGENYQPNEQGRFPSNVIGEIAEPYQKYFYCPKVSRAERHIGFNNVDALGKQLYELGGYWIVDNKPQPFSGSAPGNQCYLPGVGNIFVHGLNHEIEKINKSLGKTPNIGNNHPTVKPIELMKYLIKLVTPPNGKVLDPFNGSGSTGMAAVELGYEYIGIEQDANYCEISKKRIEAWLKIQDPLRASGLFT